ncbi:hypothetical protein [Dyadobacter sp. 32]|uniref:hypothetical protein n=1 Tax=Dyadobacter sp. 32 TaxID=538966 RepID=UPI0011EC585F
MATKNDEQILFDDLAELTKLGLIDGKIQSVSVNCDCNGFTNPNDHEGYVSQDRSGRSYQAN